MEKTSKITKRKTGLIVTAICAVAAITVVLTAAMPMGGGGGRGPGGGEGMEQEEADIVVDTMNPILGNIYVQGEFVGTVEPNQQVTVYPKASGEVLRVNFNVGDTVQQGDVLFQIDSSTLQNTIAQSQASIASSEALAQLNLNQAELDLENYQSRLEDGYNSTIVSAENEVENAKNSVSSAQSSLLQARSDLRDARSDGDDTSVTNARKSVTSAEYTLESAQLRLEQAEAALELAKKSVEDQEVSLNNSLAKAELNADLTQQYLALQQQQKQLGDYNVTAPISGVIEQRNIDAYDMASTSGAAFVISNKDAMTISFNVSETTLGYLQIGDTVTVEKNGETSTGYITEISTMVDSSTGLFTVKANVENPKVNLLSGSMVKLFANTKKAENDMMIPIDSVYYEDNRPYVFRYEDGKAVQTFIETGISDENYIQVFDGLDWDDQIVSTWSSHLMDGVEITLVGEVKEKNASQQEPDQEAQPEAGSSHNDEADLQDNEAPDRTSEAEGENDSPAPDTEEAAE